jgi:hypothetical protein
MLEHLKAGHDFEAFVEKFERVSEKQREEEERALEERRPLIEGKHVAFARKLSERVDCIDYRCKDRRKAGEL